MLTQEEKSQRNESFNHWSFYSLSSKALWFHSLQIVKKMRRGAMFHTFFIFFPTKEPCQPKRRALTEEGIIHGTLNKENNRCHRSLTLKQWRSKWSIDSSSCLHRQHLFTKGRPFLWRLFKVSTLTQLASQTKKLTLDGTHNFQIMFFGKMIALPTSRTSSKDLTENNSFLL